MQPENPQSPPRLKRSLSLSLLTLYGIGTILGAGIYVLIGEVTQIAGLYAPLAFLLAGVLAAFTAFSYAELSARYPFSAGEAYYVQQSFGLSWLSALMGWLVVVIGITSAATMANGFAGYLKVFIQMPDWLSIGLLVLSLGVLAAIGILESVLAAALITLLEIGGLLMVVFIGRSGFSHVPEMLPVWIEQMNLGSMELTLAGAFLAFYAFIGFEDMVNVAEEVKDPRRNLPLGITLALVISTSLYLCVALVAVLSLPQEIIAGSEAPLAELIRHHQPSLVPMITIISMIAIINGALIQIIMASRVMYGMADKGLAYKPLAYVHPKTHTPLLATAICTALILILGIGFGLVTLAKLTSFITLMIFAGVNLALVTVKFKSPKVENIINVPIWSPVIGFILCLFFLGFELIN